MAQQEQEIISKRTKEALQAKKLMEPDWKPGTPANLTEEAKEASWKTREMKAAQNTNNKQAAAHVMQLKEKLIDVLDKKGKPTGKKRNISWGETAALLNKGGFKTSKGGIFQATQAMRLYTNTPKQAYHSWRKRPPIFELVL